MIKTDNLGILRLIYGATKYKMFNFMASIIMLLILSTVLVGYKYSYLVVNTASTIVFILGIYAVGKNKRNVIILLLLGMPWFLSEWVFAKSSETIFASVLYFLFITGTIIDHILHSEEVSTDTLYEAVCVFLLFGLLYASIYAFLEYITPGIIFVNNNAEVLNPLTTNEIIYYSYTTLTSLGYGDITSLHPVGKIVSVLEAITGQLFVAFFIARLVAIYTANALRRRSDS